MRRTVLQIAGLAGLLAAGCTLTGGESAVSPDAPQFARIERYRAPAPVPVQPSVIQQASFLTPALPKRDEAPLPDGPLGVDDLVRLAVERNPRIARATLAVDAAQGRYVQAGLYPNPDLGFQWEEIGDKQGVGIITVPRVTQTIVTGRKLSLAQVVVAREVDQATLDVLTERYAVVGSVRATFYEVFALQQRFDILNELVRLASQAVDQGKDLFAKERIARLDLVQLELELERFRAEAEAVERELPAAFRKLAAVTGDPRLPSRRLAAPFDSPPLYDLDTVRDAVLEFHPEARSARVAVTRAEAAVRSAEVQPIPNVSVSAGFIRQFENKSYDAGFGLSAPIPTWNRNQGNIRAARAELGMAVQHVGQVENALTDRLAVAFRTYAAARQRAEQYRREIIPRAEDTNQMSLSAFKGGQFEYLRVIQSQRVVAEARLERNKSLGEAWKAAGEISGMLLEEVWPIKPTNPAK
jgi:cobalt-zinc-cadmium efflux system outer membrane protein